MIRRAWALLASAVLLAALASASIAAPASAGNEVSCESATSGWDHYYDAPKPPRMLPMMRFPYPKVCDW